MPALLTTPFLYYPSSMIAITADALPVCGNLDLRPPFSCVHVHNALVHLGPDGAHQSPHYRWYHDPKRKVYCRLSVSPACDSFIGMLLDPGSVLLPSLHQWLQDWLHVVHPSQTAKSMSIRIFVSLFNHLVLVSLPVGSMEVLERLKAWESYP